MIENINYYIPLARVENVNYYQYIKNQINPWIKKITSS